MIQRYVPTHIEGQSSSSRPLEFGSQHIDDSSKADQILSEIDPLEESNIIDLDISIEHFDNVAIMTLTYFDLSQSDDSFPLVQPKLID